MKRSIFQSGRRRNITSSRLKVSKKDENTLKYEALNSEINILVRTINLNYNFKDFKKNNIQSLETVNYIFYKNIYIFLIYHSFSPN